MHRLSFWHSLLTKNAVNWCINLECYQMNITISFLYRKTSLLTSEIDMQCVYEKKTWPTENKNNENNGNTSICCCLCLCLVLKICLTVVLVLSLLCSLVDVHQRWAKLTLHCKKILNLKIMKWTNSFPFNKLHNKGPHIVDNHKVFWLQKSKWSLYQSCYVWYNQSLAAFAL